jgi:2-methylisocitrate lyase-like PEP mutase family enzyme
MTTATAADKRKRLKARLDAPGLIVAPGMFEMISARIADRLGFDCLYVTGYGTVASALGVPDAGIATYSDMVGRVGAYAANTATPFIADGDTGYGGLLNIHHTVRGYEAAGAAGIQIEDQEQPKKCGHTPGRRVAPFEEAVRRIKVANDARSSADFLIVARTDARTSLGLDETLRRAEAFRRAGADVLFVESPESEAEFEQIGRSLGGCLLANMVEGGRSPVLAKATLETLGFKIAIYPGTAFLAAAAAMTEAYRHIRDTGSSRDLKAPIMGFADMNALMGFEEVWAFDRKWAE